ncbi:---NA--- [Octopus vulgaris]|uniref:---NA n=1 Tax=Octopus vulgaris TaxID=6645 RepID=A0AA36AX83_OCTVU|nr:---NA--- [Octopus vulgaris]
MLKRPHIKTLDNIIENYCGKAVEDEEDEKEKEAGSLCDPGVPQENGSPTPVNDQVVKDRGAKGEETGSPPIPVVLRRNEKLEKQKKKGRTENKNKEGKGGKGGKGKTTKAETPTHHTNSREPHGGSNATQYTSGKKKSGRHRRTCKFDLRGKCWHGEDGKNCRFAHPTPRQNFRGLKEKNFTEGTQEVSPRKTFKNEVRSSDVLRNAASEQESFLCMAERIVRQLTWLHQAQRRNPDHHYARPPQSTDTGWPPLTPAQPSLQYFY